MNHKYVGYRCSLCGKHYDPCDILYTCPEDGGNLDVLLDYGKISEAISPKDILEAVEGSLWRYLPLLPVDHPTGWGTPLHYVGNTPVYSTARIADKYKLRSFWVKDESTNPTASFKDRASAILVVRAHEIGAQVVVTASTGNAGAALAGMAAAASQRAVIFAPKSAPPAKVAQLLVYNAEVILVDGTYDDAFDLTLDVAREFGWYCRNTGYNPFTAEGKKTAAFEIWDWFSQPDNRTRMQTRNGKQKLLSELSIFVSVGDGNIISGIHKGFKDLKELGWIDQLPKIYGVQAAGSAAIANAYHAGHEDITPVSANTLADSIAVDLPRDGVRALRAVRETGGDYIVVNDREILIALAELGQDGIFAEPAGAAAFAGFLRALQERKIAPREPFIVINTGSGLKDVRAAMEAVQQAPIIEPSIAALKRYMNDQRTR
jgi:threonine synthase